MTLRVRLAGAFFVLIMAPALLGAVLVSGALAGGPGPGDRMARAEQALRVAVTARCHALEVRARALADHAAARGEPYAASPAGSFGPWAICGVDAAGAPLTPGARFGALAARAEIRHPDGVLTGYAYALQPLDAEYLRELSAVAGAPVAAAPAGSAPAEGSRWPLPVRVEDRVVEPPTPGRPAVTIALVIAVVVVAAVLAGVFGWWLAGIATWPLGALLGAVERAAAGDLTARSRVGGRDETGRLGCGVDQLIEGLQESQLLSITDPLTGIGNVRHLRESLRIEVERAQRFGREFGVLVIDLDRFKAVNDAYGHRAGDTVLVEFVRRVRAVIREVDLAFRQGGEEFVILLPETDVAGSLTAARRIVAAVRDMPFRLDGGSGEAAMTVPITVSIGVAVFPRHASSGPGVLDAADAALYAAKAAGRDTYVLANSALPDQREPAEPARDAFPATTSPRPQSPG